LLDEGEDVAEVENAARHAVWIEGLECVERFPCRREHDRPAGDGCHGERCSTASVAVELREHNAGEVDTLLERARCRDRILADHRVDDEEHFVRVDGLADVRGLLHEFRVDTEAARGIDDNRVVKLRRGVFDRVSCDPYRVADTIAGLRCEDSDTGLLTDDLQLGDSVWPLKVGRDEERRVPFAREPLR
jgi:hypothetical protein